MWPAGAEHPMVAMGHGPAASSPSSSATAALPAAHSPWQSPVPYLFGGLAAMLGLIALSLLALACSYWKLSGSLAAGEHDDVEHQADTAGRRDGEKGSAAGKAGSAWDRWREHVVVIMAGDERPTFLATPAAGRPDGEAASCSGGSEERRCVEFGARARSEGSEDDALSPSEQTITSGSSVISAT
uniref:GDU1 n=1 Tax=Arundo donax TaxID=35708 RepID=A0A0A8XN88_ARUDO